MKNNPKYIYSGIRGVLKHEGLKGLVSRGTIFLSHRFFMFEDYYVVFQQLDNLPQEDEGDFLPLSDDFYSKIITTNKEADDLVSEGFVFGAYEPNLRASLDKDVISFSLFIGKEFAHVSCLADNPRGKHVIDPRPFDINYPNGDIVIGRALTVPKFRRLHLQMYNGFVFRRYCRERGIKRIMMSLNAHSIPALATAHQDFDSIVTSKCRYTKILCFKHLKEQKIESVSLNQIVSQMTGR